jgi:hypothetical protein
MRLGWRSLTVASGIEWSGDLTARVNQFGPKVKRAMTVAAKKVAPEAESYMRSNATWNDQSGDARRGLSTEVEVNTNNVVVYLYHTVPYGPWLELRWSGKYQIINPTIEVFAPQLIQLVADLAFD